MYYIFSLARYFLLHCFVRILFAFWISCSLPKYVLTRYKMSDKNVCMGAALLEPPRCLDSFAPELLPLS